MDLYAYSTPSHDHMRALYFQSSAEETGWDVHVTDGPQTCMTGGVNTQGFMATQVCKWSTYLKAAEQTPDGCYFACSDVDVQFFPGSAQAIRERVMDTKTDITFQDNYGKESGVCVGFMVMRASVNLRLWLRYLIHQLTLGKYQGDQTAAWACTSDVNLPKDFPLMKWGRFPGSMVWSPSGRYARVNMLRQPVDIKIHHATWQKKGLAGKLEQLQYISQRYTEEHT